MENKIELKDLILAYIPAKLGIIVWNKSYSLLG